MVTRQPSWLVRPASDSEVLQIHRIVASCLRGIECCNVIFFLLGCMNVWVLISFSNVNCVVPNFILKRPDFAQRRMRSGSTCLRLATVDCLFTRRNYSTTHVNLDDWLTVHRSITLVDLQLDAQSSYLFTCNTFIKILYMFRALPCSSSGGLRRNCICTASGIVYTITR